MNQGLIFAIIAGCLGSLAALFTKLALSHQDAEAIFYFLLPEAFHDFYLLTALRIASFGIGLFCNGLMWTHFVKSLNLCSSSVEATVIRTAGGFVATGDYFWEIYLQNNVCDAGMSVLGFLFLGEGLPIMWWVGAVIILLGLLLIYHGNIEVPKSETLAKKLS